MVKAIRRAGYVAGCSVLLLVLVLALPFSWPLLIGLAGRHSTTI